MILLYLEMSKWMILITYLDLLLSFTLEIKGTWPRAIIPDSQYRHLPGPNFIELLDQWSISWLLCDFHFIAMLIISTQKGLLHKNKWRHNANPWRIHCKHAIWPPSFSANLWIIWKSFRMASPLFHSIWRHHFFIRKSFRMAPPLFHSIWNNIVSNFPD